MSDAAIELNSLHFSVRGQTLIDGLNLSIPSAGVTAIMGPNGAGKSLTLRIIAGLIKPSSGDIRFAGTMPEPKDLAIVFQRPVLLRRTVRGNLMHTLKVLQKTKDRASKLKRLLVLGGLEHLADRPARRLSGGEQQRLATVRALAGAPRFLLMDEPTASLDPRATRDVEALISDAARAGTKVVIVTHDRGQAARLADDIALMHDGRLAEHRPAKEFLSDPRSVEGSAYLTGDLLI
ncbi:MAG: ATP-binding cassette domain-containing protein [Pseudomonadota bacterium]